MCSNTKESRNKNNRGGNDNEKDLRNDATFFGCSGMFTDQPAGTAGLAKPVNCPTAEGDIRVLQSEKAHVMTQIASGVTALVPAAAVMSVATGSEKAKLQVASGEYNRAIDDKIAAIKKTCGM